MTTKQKNAIKEAQLAGQLIGGFAATQPQAYKLVSQFTCEEFLGGHQVNQNEFATYIRNNTQGLSSAAFQRVYQSATTNFKTVTGYGLTSFDSGLEKGCYAQYAVTPVDFNFTVKTDEEMAECIASSLSFIIGGSTVKNMIVDMKVATFKAATETFQKELV